MQGKFVGRDVESPTTTNRGQTRMAAECATWGSGGISSKELEHEELTQRRLRAAAQGTRAANVDGIPRCHAEAGAHGAKVGRPL